MKVLIVPAGAPSGLMMVSAKSRTAPITASNADVARRSASSWPLMPLVGIRRVGCQ